MRKEYDFSKSVKNPYAKKVKKLTYADFKKEALKNPEFKKAYDALEDEYKIKRELIRMRKKSGLTQEELGKKVK